MRALPPALALALLLQPSLALAHGLHDSRTFLGGAAHPLSGADHVLAMVAVGLLAAQTGGRALWAMPLGFVVAMLAGGALGASAPGLPVIEPMILASVIVLGALIAMSVRLPPGLALSLIALFGAAHGWAHGAEGPQTGQAFFAAGFALVTALLHLSGIALGRGLGAVALRGAGAGAALAGLALAVA
ncbi:MAG: HupE/UreJ family protein [Rhodobacter sp.]|uniref:HupE/UreJ family protein n=1 Tax=Pararhodobacter sp. TaxID=2127056 RepID=UPI001D5B556C|nr:HupE/UreJ family protein [Pararhodobacter sp.]MCB1344426.1 HupE/UreJ family protein [Paracoccaceae bacterium]MCC0073717.1 HupE/UreJ family protein [Rhodobacter sp.]HPD92721.1 HupE/UreJ family protein [Pararhodobacter sp.]